MHACNSYESYIYFDFYILYEKNFNVKFHFNQKEKCIVHALKKWFD